MVKNINVSLRALFSNAHQLPDVIYPSPLKMPDETIQIIFKSETQSSSVPDGSAAASAKLSLPVFICTGRSHRTPMFPDQLWALQKAQP